MAAVVGTAMEIMSMSMSMSMERTVAVAMIMGNMHMHMTMKGIRIITSMGRNAAAATTTENIHTTTIMRRNAVVGTIMRSIHIMTTIMERDAAAATTTGNMHITTRITGRNAAAATIMENIHTTIMITETAAAAAMTTAERMNIHAAIHTWKWSIIRRPAIRQTVAAASAIPTWNIAMSAVRALPAVPVRCRMRIWKSGSISWKIWDVPTVLPRWRRRSKICPA